MPHVIDISVVKDGLTALGLQDAVVQHAAVPLLRYTRLLYTRGQGLISSADRSDIHRLFVRHILDSLAPWHVIEKVQGSMDNKAYRLYDIGSGAGLPGIPLSLVLPWQECVLVESRTRRAAFLEKAIKGLGLNRLDSSASNASMLRICVTDANILRAREQENVHNAIVVFRAYRSTNKSLLRSLCSNFPAGTPIIAYKGRLQKAEQEAAIIQQYAKVVDIIPAPVPELNAERCALLFQLP